MSKKTALVTGAYGQDASYLIEILIEQGFDVTGLVRPSGTTRYEFVQRFLGKGLNLWYADVSNPFVIHQIASGGYDHIYLLAAHTQVTQSFWDPTSTLRVNAESPIAIFNALKVLDQRPRVYFAATSEMFADQVRGSSADENHPLTGRSPYAIAKIAAFQAARIYRKMGLFIVNGIGFNHESCRRGDQFVTRKLGLGLRRFKTTGIPVHLGTGMSMRDWHHARDTMRGAFLAMSHDVPDDYVFASGRSRSVLELAQDLCARLGVPEEQAVVYDAPGLQRLWEVPYLRGNPGKAENVLGWKREVGWDALLEDVSREGWV